MSAIRQNIQRAWLSIQIVGLVGYCKILDWLCAILSNWERYMMSDKKPKFDELDFSDITGEKDAEVPAPVELPALATVAEQKPEPLKDGTWLWGVPLEDCTASEVKTWASSLIPHKSISELKEEKLNSLQAKKRVVDNVSLLMTMLGGLNTNRKVSKQYLQ